MQAEKVVQKALQEWIEYDEILQVKRKKKERATRLKPRYRVPLKGLEMQESGSI